VLKAELGQAQATLARDEATQRQAELNLSYTAIVSPVVGRQDRQRRAETFTGSHPGHATMSNSIALGSPHAIPLPANSSEKANLTSWIAVLAGMIGAFMAILNIQITNA
jgi:multidrug efflux pump subunit AcrA (membrane-fusion protein)